LIGCIIDDLRGVPEGVCLPDQVPIGVIFIGDYRIDTVIVPMLLLGKIPFKGWSVEGKGPVVVKPAFPELRAIFRSRDIMVFYQRSGLYTNSLKA
jgi:hypothetical protein